MGGGSNPTARERTNLDLSRPATASAPTRRFKASRILGYSTRDFHCRARRPQSAPTARERQLLAQPPRRPSVADQFDMHARGMGIDAILGAASQRGADERRRRELSRAIPNLACRLQERASALLAMQSEARMHSDLPSRAVSTWEEVQQALHEGSARLHEALAHTQPARHRHRRPSYEGGMGGDPSRRHLTLDAGFARVKESSVPAVQMRRRRCTRGLGGSEAVAARAPAARQAATRAVHSSRTRGKSSSSAAAVAAQARVAAATAAKHRPLARGGSIKAAHWSRREVSMRATHLSVGDVLAKFEQLARALQNGVTHMPRLLHRVRPPPHPRMARCRAARGGEPSAMADTVPHVEVATASFEEVITSPIADLVLLHDALQLGIDAVDKLARAVVLPEEELGALAHDVFTVHKYAKKMVHNTVMRKMRRKKDGSKAREREAHHTKLLVAKE